MNNRRKWAGPIGLLTDYVRRNPTWAMPFVFLAVQILAAAWCFLIWKSR
jgi:hypothetical protein